MNRRGVVVALVACCALEQVASRSMECFQAAKSLREDGFRNSSDRIPDPVVQVSKQSGRVFEESSNRRSSARDKNMCR